MLTETESDREFPNSLSQELGIELDAVAINGLKFNCNAIEFTILTNTLHEIRNDLLITFLVAPNLFTKKHDFQLSVNIRISAAKCKRRSDVQIQVIALMSETINM